MKNGRKSFFGRIISILTIFSFILSTFYIPGAESQAGADNVYAALSGAFPGSPSGAGPMDLTPGKIVLPLSLGEIKDFRESNNGITIIHIQDAHGNYSAQRSIAGVMDHLSSTYGVNLAFLEGGAGNYDLSVFTGIEDKDIRLKVSDYFLKQGRVSGAEFFAVNEPGRMELFGIEEEGLYNKNLTAYRLFLSMEKEKDKCLGRLSSLIAGFKEKIYSEEVKELDRAVTAYRDKTVELKDHISFLLGRMNERGIDIKDYPCVSEIESVLKNETEIDFKRAGKERAQLIERLQEKLSPAELERLARKMLDLKKGDIANEDFYAYLFEKAAFTDVDMGSMPSLVSYSEYIRKYEALDKAALFREIDEAREKLISGSLKTEDEARLHELDKNFLILEKMLNVSLLKTDFDYYMKNRENFTARKFTEFMISKSAKYGVEYAPEGSLDILDAARSRMEDFYSYSFERDTAFISNIENKLKTASSKTAVLVTGGFHTANLKNIFEKKGYGYIGIMPGMDAHPAENHYFELLGGAASAMEKTVEAALSNIAVHSMLSEMGVPERRIFDIAVDISARLLRDGQVTLLMPHGYTTLALGQERVLGLAADRLWWTEAKQDMTDKDIVGFVRREPVYADKIGEIDGEVVYAVRMRYEKKYDPRDDTRALREKGAIELSKAIQVLLPGEYLEGDKLSPRGHEPGDTLIAMAHDPAYKDIEAHDLAVLIKGNDEIWERLKLALVETGLSPDAVELMREILSRDNAADTVWIMTGPGKTGMWRKYYHRSFTKKRIHLSLYGNARDMDFTGLARGLVHELGALAGLSDAENRENMNDPAPEVITRLLTNLDTVVSGKTLKKQARGPRLGFDHSKYHRREEALLSGERLWGRGFHADRKTRDIMTEYIILSAELSAHYGFIREDAANLFAALREDVPEKMLAEYKIKFSSKGYITIDTRGASSPEETRNVLESVIRMFTSAESPYKNICSLLWEKTGGDYWKKAVETAAALNSRKETLKLKEIETINAFPAEHFLRALYAARGISGDSGIASEKDIIELLKRYADSYDNNTAKLISARLDGLLNIQAPVRRKNEIYEALSLLVSRSGSLPLVSRYTLRALSWSYITGLPEAYIASPNHLEEFLEFEEENNVCDFLRACHLVCENMAPGISLSQRQGIYARAAGAHLAIGRLGGIEFVPAENGRVDHNLAFEPGENEEALRENTARALFIISTALEDIARKDLSGDNSVFLGILKTGMGLVTGNMNADAESFMKSIGITDDEEKQDMAGEIKALQNMALKIKASPDNSGPRVKFFRDAGAYLIHIMMQYTLSVTRFPTDVLKDERVAQRAQEALGEIMGWAANQCRVINTNDFPGMDKLIGYAGELLSVGGTQTNLGADKFLFNGNWAARYNVSSGGVEECLTKTGAQMIAGIITAKIGTLIPEDIKRRAVKTTMAIRRQTREERKAKPDKEDFWGAVRVSAETMEGLRKNIKEFLRYKEEIIKYTRDKGLDTDVRRVEENIGRTGKSVIDLAKESGILLRNGVIIVQFPKGEGADKLMENDAAIESMVDNIQKAFGPDNPDYGALCRELWGKTGRPFWELFVEYTLLQKKAWEDLEKAAAGIKTLNSVKADIKSPSFIKTAEEEGFETLPAGHFFEKIDGIYDPEEYIPPAARVIAVLQNYTLYYNNTVSDKIKRAIKEINMTTDPGVKKRLILEACGPLLENSGAMPGALRKKFRLLVGKYIFDGMGFLKKAGNFTYEQEIADAVPSDFTKLLFSRLGLSMGKNGLDVLMAEEPDGVPPVFGVDNIRMLEAADHIRELSDKMRSLDVLDERARKKVRGHINTITGSIALYVNMLLERPISPSVLLPGLGLDKTESRGAINSYMEDIALRAEIRTYTSGPSDEKRGDIMAALSEKLLNAAFSVISSMLTSRKSVNGDIIRVDSRIREIITDPANIKGVLEIINGGKDIKRFIRSTSNMARLMDLCAELIKKAASDGIYPEKPGEPLLSQAKQDVLMAREPEEDVNNTPDTGALSPARIEYPAGYAPLVRGEASPFTGDTAENKDYFLKDLEKDGKLIARAVNRKMPEGYGIIIGGVPTDENGNPMEKISFDSPLSKIEAAGKSFITSGKLGDITLYHAMGASAAVALLSSNVPMGGIARTRIDFSIASSVLEKIQSMIEEAEKGSFRGEDDIKFHLEAILEDMKTSARDFMEENPGETARPLDFRQYLERNTMLTIIEDKKGSVVFPVRYGAGTMLSITGLNLGYVTEKMRDGKTSKDSPVYRDAVESRARAIGLFTNNTAKVDEIFRALWDEASKDPEKFIKFAYFLSLPEVKPLDFDEIKERFKQEAEVLRAL
ncbi:MAG: hypothetical protein ABH883_00570 [Candidatus Omnitrophota bacterium]